jgi:hypothetical protein
VRLRLVNKRLQFIPLFATILLRSAFASDIPPERVPIQAELLKALEPSKVSVGDPVLARVDIAWKTADCTLRKGAILKGRVVQESTRSKSIKNSEIALLFESGQCSGRDMKSLPLTVAAVVAANPAWGSTLYENEQSPPLSEAIGLGLNGGTAGNYSGSGMRKVSTAASTVLAEPPHTKQPKTVMPGQVIGLGGIKLSVGTGPEGSSVLTASKRNVRLEAGSQLVLVPTPKTEATSETAAAPAPLPDANATSAFITAANSPKVDDKSDDSEICVPPECRIETSQTPNGTWTSRGHGDTLSQGTGLHSES